jgi:uncharacterized peroxidase-related enzyme
VAAQAAGDGGDEAAAAGAGETALSPADRAMLAYARKLTLTPRAVTAADVEALRAAGFDDAAILTIAQVVGFFNYYNRLSDGLGIDPEPDWGEGPRQS